MFQPSYQNLSFSKQIIAASQSFPCPRCSSGMIEPFGITETLKCTSCERSFVALRGGRMLYPANRMELKVAPTFWWDGLRWHWAGTTASTRQILLFFAVILASVIAPQALIATNLLGKAEWLTPALATALGLSFGVGLIYSCFDFNVVGKRKERTSKSPQPDLPQSGN